MPDGDLSVAFRHAWPGVALDIAFEAPPGTTVLFGPSGAGKSSVLAVLAGLLRPDFCRIAVGGAVLADNGAGVFVPPERRRIGMVFQDARLFPHLSVAGNLRYGLRRAPPGRIGWDEVVALLGIGHLLTRRPGALSGGERQRVAIGRALLSQPRLLALDEPLASLDAGRRAEILPYLTRLGALGLPILHVTHDLAEAARLADTMVLLESGRVVASGPLDEVTRRADLPLAVRDDAAAVLRGVIAGHDAARRLTRVEAAGRTLWIPGRDAEPGAAVRLRVPAREVILATAAPEAISVHNVIAGRVGDVVMGADALVEIELDGGGLLARVTPDAVRRLGLVRGAPVLALVKSVGIDVL